MGVPVCIADNTPYCLGLEKLLSINKDYDGIYVAHDAPELIQFVRQKKGLEPICIINERLSQDIHKTIAELYEVNPDQRCILLLHDDNLDSTERFLQEGVSACVSKELPTEHIIGVLEEVKKLGHFHEQYIHENIGVKGSPHLAAEIPMNIEPVELTKREKLFMRYCCTDMKFEHIADIMNISRRTADKYREKICMKIHMKGREGIMVYAFYHNLVRYVKTDLQVGKNT